MNLKRPILYERHVGYMNLSSFMNFEPCIQTAEFLRGTSCSRHLWSGVVTTHGPAGIAGTISAVKRRKAKVFSCFQNVLQDWFDNVNCFIRWCKLISSRYFFCSMRMGNVWSNIVNVCWLLMWTSDWRSMVLLEFQQFANFLLVLLILSQVVP